MDEKKLFYTKTEVAKILGVTYWTVDNLLKSRKLKSIKLPTGAIRIPVESFEKMMKDAIKKQEKKKGSNE